MGKIYVNQSNLKLTLQTGVTLTGAAETKIKYIKPDATVGEFVAVIVGTENLAYSFLSTELNISGFWIFWAYVVFADGRNAPGEPVIINVYEQGK